jgi:hypothetical protein
VVRSSAASDVYKRQGLCALVGSIHHPWDRPDLKEIHF